LGFYRIPAMQLAYAILAPHEIDNDIQRRKFELYERYGGNSSVLTQPAHVTIKRPFAADDAEPFASYLDRLAGEVQPFELACRGYGTFDDAGVLFVALEPNEHLRAVHLRVLDELGLSAADFGERRDYHPHLTLAVGLTESMLARAREELQDEPAFSFRLRRIAIARQINASSFWTIYRVALVS
jgi:2'-5' RNA ligase